jgi:hypothetical protein
MSKDLQDHTLPDVLNLLRAESENMLDLDGLADLLEDWVNEGKHSGSLDTNKRLTRS